MNDKQGSRSEWIVAFLTLVIVLTVLSFDVHLTHFEDGSGVVTYCAPWALCAK